MLRARTPFPWLILPILTSMSIPFLHDDITHLCQYFFRKLCRTINIRLMYFVVNCLWRCGDMNRIKATRLIHIQIERVPAAHKAVLEPLTKFVSVSIWQFPIILRIPIVLLHLLAFAKRTKLSLKRVWKLPPTGTVVGPTEGQESLGLHDGIHHLGLHVEHKFHSVMLFSTQLRNRTSQAPRETG